MLLWDPWELLSRAGGLLCHTTTFGAWRGDGFYPFLSQPCPSVPTSTWVPGLCPACCSRDAELTHLGQVSLEKEIFISMEFSWLDNNLIGYSLQ